MDDFRDFRKIMSGILMNQSSMMLALSTVVPAPGMADSLIKQAQNVTEMANLVADGPQPTKKTFQ